ncbi:MAG: twin-arginine translocase TatA/TatE family subunit [Acidimicrobiia bacterium]
MIQGGEVIIILIVALVVLGPSRLPDLARNAGQYAAELRRAAREVREGLEAEVSDLKDAGDELREVNREIRKPFDEARQSIDEVGVNRLEWKGPKPLSGPTPADAMADLEEIEARQKLEEQAVDDDEGDEGTT